MKKIIVSAPGKIHLRCEQAVVHGKPAVVAAISKRLYVTIESQKSILRLRSGQELKNQKDIEKVSQEKSYLGKIVQLVQKYYQTHFSDFTLTIHSDIPKGGMGSSAALAVATIGALTQYLQKPWDVKEINDLAYQAVIAETSQFFIMTRPGRSNFKFLNKISHSQIFQCF